MSKTKEINVWVNDELVKYPDGVRYQTISLNTSISEFKYKAKLIIEIPEKKIEITESQFDEIVNYYHDHYIRDTDVLFDLKEKLFNTKKENP